MAGQWVGRRCVVMRCARGDSKFGSRQSSWQIRPNGSSRSPHLQRCMPCPVASSTFTCIHTIPQTHKTSLRTRRVLGVLASGVRQKEEVRQILRKPIPKFPTSSSQPAGHRTGQLGALYLPPRIHSHALDARDEDHFSAIGPHLLPSFFFFLVSRAAH